MSKVESASVSPSYLRIFVIQPALSIVWAIPKLGMRRLQPVLDVMNEAVVRYDGVVNKSQGDGVMALLVRRSLTRITLFAAASLRSRCRMEDGSAILTCKSELAFTPAKLLFRR